MKPGDKVWVMATVEEVQGKSVTVAVYDPINPGWEIAYTTLLRVRPRSSRRTEARGKGK